MLTSISSSYDLLEAAQGEMDAGGGLSPDTIKKLADAEENYLDYLYEENGVVKLNTTAWKENANAKMQSEMTKIQNEIASLEEQNKVLNEQIDAKNKLYRTSEHKNESWFQQSAISDIAELSGAIDENNKKIQENQSKLAVWGVFYRNITGDLDAYTNALNNFFQYS